MPALSDESPAPQSGAIASVTRDDILTKLRATATWLDPAHAGVYRAMSTDRWINAADLAADLMIEHCRYHRRRPGGRRAHGAAVHQRLDGANQTQLVAALAWVHLPFWLLSARPQHDE